MRRSLTARGKVCWKGSAFPHICGHSPLNQVFETPIENLFLIKWFRRSLMENLFLPKRLCNSETEDLFFLTRLCCSETEELFPLKRLCRPDVRKVSDFPAIFLFCFEAAPQTSKLMFYISKNNPCYFITSVTNKRLPIFRTEQLKDICCGAFDEARKSSGMRLFAYVIMDDHYHVITDGELKPSVVLRYLNGVSARRVIEYLKKNNFHASLEKLKSFEKNRNYKYSVWQHHSNVFLLTSESAFFQKLNYIHQNPVRAGAVENVDDYLYSSSRIWRNKPLEDSPLAIDVKEIKWRER